MQSEMKQIKNQTETKSESIRIGKEGRKMIDGLLKEINQPFKTKRISPARLISLLPQLVTDEIKRELRAEVKTPEEKQEIWRAIYVRENGEITKRNFHDFTTTPEYATFLNRHKTEYKRQLLVG